MLCPDCKAAAPGGSPCPHCGHTIPERESFAGQGVWYILVLTGVSAALLVVSLMGKELGIGGAFVSRLFATGWTWLGAAFIITPLAVGVYYWYLLRDEEIVVTDEAISRHSHWGDESLRWADVRAFRRRSIPLRQNRLGRLAWFSRFLPSGRPTPHRLSCWPGSAYELVGPADSEGQSPVMRLEPGTIDDLPWLLEIVQERLGPPQQG